jgi:hypothetical protein
MLVTVPYVKGLLKLEADIREKFPSLHIHSFQAVSIYNEVQCNWDLVQRSQDGN